MVKEGLKPDQSQVKFNFMDIRYKGKKAGAGIYLNTRMDIAEEHLG